MSDDPDAIMSDDPMVLKLEAQCAAMNGEYWNGDLGLTQLLNPSKVVNLERQIVAIKAEIEGEPSMGAEERAEAEAKITKLEAKQTMEMRGVMRDWLKAVFVWQSVLSILVCGLCVYDAVPFFPHLSLVVRVLGFWGIWLFTIPSLRSRKPGGVWGMSNQEKTALDISFLLTPLVNIGLLPLAGPDPIAIFWANLVALGGCYAFGFATAGEAGGIADASLPEPIKFAIKALDFGAGSERGMKMEVRERVEERQRLEKQAAREASVAPPPLAKEEAEEKEKEEGAAPAAADEAKVETTA